MIMNCKYNTLDVIPEELLILAKSLQHLGIVELAWDWDNVIKVIDILSESNYAILGGDVYKLNKGKLEAVYDNWYTNKDKGKPIEEFIELSRSRAISYINQYHLRNGNTYYFSIVAEKLS